LKEDVERIEEDIDSAEAELAERNVLSQTTASQIDIWWRKYSHLK
jgi:hypothetical protein